jgi:hypothetical protein
MRELLNRASALLRSHGSLEAFMRQCAQAGDFLETLNRFSRELSPSREVLPAPAGGKFSLLAAPENGSACKRLALYLKWMVRHDDVDPGGWTVFSPQELIVPTDTHMHGIALRLGLTARKQADLKTALEITRAFARFCPEDPARYDFALTRFGIRGALSVSELAEYSGVSGGPARKPERSAEKRQAFTQSPQRMHSGLSGEREGSTPILQTLEQAPQRAQFPSSSRIR